MPEGQKLPSLYQSVGANGVTNLAAKLLMTMLPPNEPCFRLRINNMVLEKQNEDMDADFLAIIEKALSRVEQAVLADVEAQSDRPVVNEGNCHLIVGGNVLYHNDPEEGLRMFPLSRYVVDRDSMGTPIEIIVKEDVGLHTLPEDFLEALKEEDDAKYKRGDEVSHHKRKDKEDDDVEIYTHLKRKGDKWHIHQECLGHVVPDSVGTYKLDDCPWFPVRMYSVAGEDYGRSFVEQQIGDLNSLESLNQALVEAAAVSGKVIFFVNPNGYTSSRAVAEAENGAVLEGAAQDVTVMQVQKGNDLQVVAQKAAALEQSIKTAFLMMDGIRRQAERVTAEEIRLIAQELESGLGGVYTVISQEFQLPFIRSRMAAMSKDGRLPELPKDLVSPSIVTGFEAIGRGNDKTKLVEFLQFGAQTFGEAFMQYLEPINAITTLASSMGINTDGLIKTKEAIEQEQAQAQQQMQQQSMMENLGPSMVSAGADMMTNPQMQGMMQQMMGGGGEQPAPPEGAM